MQLQDIEFFEGGGGLESFTAITCAPQTNARWLAQDLAQRHGGTLVELGVSSPSIAPASDFVVVTNTELPVLSGAVSADELFASLQRARESVKHLVVCVTISEALLDDYYETGRQLARFVTKVLYEAPLILQLRPLETGRSPDITGRFVVAKGPRRGRTVVERELFYRVKPRGAVEFTMK